jgi:HTH-type transcriptional regulator / antitoxin HigA
MIGKMTIGTVDKSIIDKDKHFMSIATCEKYIDLVNEFPPCPEADFIAVQKVIDDLLDAGQISSDRRKYLKLLGMIIHEYEERTVEIPDIDGVELLNVPIEEWGLKQKELVPIFKTESNGEPSATAIASAIINGHRQLTVEHIEKLSAFFHVSPAVFFPQPR